MSQIIDGKLVSKQVRQRVKNETDELKAKGITPGLAVIIVGDDPASQVYVKNKEKACDEVGFYSEKYALPENTTQEELNNLVKKLNNKIKYFKSEFVGLKLYLSQADFLKTKI